MAWAKALTEIALETDFDKIDNQQIEITLDTIARKVVKYYWEQTIYFDLKQGSNPLKPPKILSVTKSLISKYQHKANSTHPIKYLKSNVENICETEYEITIKQVIAALKQDVSYRFISLGGKIVEGIYEYEKGDNSLCMTLDNLRVLKDNYGISFEAINYRWSQILENFNQTPRICKKVRIIDIEEIRRTPLSKFIKYLDYENPEHSCFICGKNIEGETPSLDHVIAWSYLYSDDIWNLVFAHRSCNSSKSNIIPNEQVVNKLEKRNLRLLEALIENGVNNKETSELQFAIEHNLVKKFWISCQG
jgi:5-methylcytosine-specific restriction endonuclease McrA